jgi:lipopolysaccharide transport system ATP-binding protein
MSDVAIDFCHVYKKFKRGEKFDSLRDFIPYLTRKYFSVTSGDLTEKEFWAVKDVSFQLKYGEAIGIIGPNGAGKSTILKLLSGILLPTKGTYKVNGRISALIEVGAGFHPDLTGEENIYLNGAILGMTREQIRKKYDAIVEFSELEEFIETPVKRYSSGMYARLGFSVAVHVDPQILLIDEVLSVGDISFQQKCLNKMQEIINNGTTIIFISHNIPAVIKLCPKTILLDRGSIHQFGETKDVCRHYYNITSQKWRGTEENHLELENVELFSSNGSPTTAFRPGDPARVRFVIGSKIGINNLAMSLFIKRSDGMIVFDASSNIIGQRYFSFSEGERKTVDLSFKVNLPQGTYYVGMNLFDPGKGFYLYKDEAIEFYVDAPKTEGYAFLELQWKPDESQ